MECKSIIQSSSSSSTTRKYDVFVSFRGEDVRNTFADHLFAAFQRKGIVAFKDDRNLKQGDHISTELMQAIEGSQVLIVIFSKNYATSSWCLQELAKIVDCLNTEVPTGQSVLPVFYDVSPSEVRKQSGDYGKAFVEHEERFKHDLQMVKRWREALVKMANLSGWDVHNKPQYGQVEKIVERVKSILGYKLSSDLDGLVGIHSRVEKLEKLIALDSNDDIRVVGVCGMGGIGKTTLARAVYDRNFRRYDASCFIDDVSKVYHDGGLIATKRQLICQTLNEEIQDIWNLSKANYLIKTRLCHLKALIVLDNVDKVEQLEKLGVSRDCLHTGSRIIVVSRDQHILDEYGMDEVYGVELLNVDEARILFCRKAFKHDYIMSCDDISKEYEKLTDLALQYAQCLPLAIEVLGSFLYGKNISEWKSALGRLRDNPKKEIMDVLQISFDGLEHMEKEIFLDVACFFKYSQKGYVKSVLDYCGFHTDIGIRVLIDRSLITIEGTQITMHDMLQELGRKIVRQKAPNEPGQWSRIWRSEDFHSIMYENMEMDSLKGIMLSHQNQENMTLRAEAFSKMNRLQLLIIFKYVNFSGSLSSLSNNLRYLEWKDYPFTYFPSSCELTKLVKLFLPYSSINHLWEGFKPLYSLKVMDLYSSENLVQIPDLSGAPNLEKLILEGCTKLVHIHPSIGVLRKLVHLNLNNCTSLMCLPNSIFGVCSLEVINLHGCSKLFHSKFPENAIQCQSKSSIFKRLKLMLPFHLFNSKTQHHDILGQSLARFYNLRELDLSYCNLVNVPEAMSSFCCLEGLKLAGNNFVTLPCVIKELPRLKRLWLDNCKQLTYLSEFPLRTDLHVRKGPFRQRVRVSIFNCPKLLEKERWSNIAFSWMIQFLKVHKESSRVISIVIPGTQIPSWFNTQSVGKNYMRIDPFLNVHDNNWIGLAFCVAFDTQYNPTSSSDAGGLQTNIYCTLGGTGPIAYLCPVAELIKTDADPVELVHLCLFYLTRQYLKDLIQRRKANLHDHGGFVFRITLGNSVHDYVSSDYNSVFEFLGKPAGLELEVKHCAMRTVFKQDLE